MEKEVHHQVSTLDKKLGDSASMEKKKRETRNWRRNRREKLNFDL